MRTPAVSLAAILAFFLASAGSARSAADEEKRCIDCHSDMRKELAGKFNHTPFAVGECESCHRFHGFVPRMELHGAVFDVCVRCHVDTFELPRDALHYPVTEEEDSCLLCHEPHGAEREKLLSGDPGELCMECHDGPAEGAASHPPFAEKNCVQCHEPHGSIFPHFLKMPPAYLCIDCHYDVLGEASPDQMHAFDNGSLCERCHSGHTGMRKGEAWRGDALCARCHEGIAGLTETGMAHSALSEGECLDCHEPHFKTGTRGLSEPAPALCFSCHGDVEERTKAAVPHDAAEDCSSCHDPHERFAADAQPALCANCHEIEDADFIAGHAGIAPQRCTDCHDPHGSPAALLIRELQHGPFAERDCETCHDPGQSRTDLRASSLCLDCHDEPEARDPHAPAVISGRVCVDCHTPHASKRSGLLR